MKTIIAISVILVHVISASELGRDDFKKYIERWKRMNERECDHLRTKSSSYKFYELDSVVDARPNGYRAKIKFSVIGEREAWIILSKEDGTNKKLESALDIAIGFKNGKESFLQRWSGTSKTRLKEAATPDVITSLAPTDVIVAMTDDGVLTLTIEGSTIFTHHESNPFEIRYFGFATHDNSDVQFYFNCTLNVYDGSDDGGPSAANIHSANLIDRLFCALTTLIASTVLHCWIATTIAYKGNW